MVRGDNLLGLIFRVRFYYSRLVIITECVRQENLASNTSILAKLSTRCSEITISDSNIEIGVILNP